jgi:hypothetical protein
MIFPFRRVLTIGPEQRFLLDERTSFATELAKPAQNRCTRRQNLAH